MLEVFFLVNGENLPCVDNINESQEDAFAVSCGNALDRADKRGHKRKHCQINRLIKNLMQHEFACFYGRPTVLSRQKNPSNATS